MKVPVDIDLRRASSTLCQFGSGAKFTEKVDGCFGTERSRCPAIPSQIMERTSAARANCDLDKEAILSRSCLLVSLSAPSVDSPFILLTSCETNTGSISEKLCHENETLGIVQIRGNSRDGETGENLVNDIAVRQVDMDVRLCLLFEGWYVILKRMNRWTARRSMTGHLVCKPVH